MAGRTGKPVEPLSAFRDASALVPLCVGQSITPRAVALYRSYDAVVWWGTPVEIASALARLVRMKLLDSISPGSNSHLSGIGTLLPEDRSQADQILRRS